MSFARAAEIHKRLLLLHSDGLEVCRKSVRQLTPNPFLSYRAPDAPRYFLGRELLLSSDQMPDI